MVVVGFAVVLAVSGQASAASVTANLDVTSNVQAVCTVNASAVNFGAAGDGNVYAQGAVSVNCTEGAPYVIGLGAGANSESGLSRRLRQGTSNAYLNYGLSADTSFGTSWGDQGISSGTTFPYPAKPGVGDGLDQVHTVYGVLSPVSMGTGVIAGEYSDIVLVSVDY